MSDEQLHPKITKFEQDFQKLIEKTQPKFDKLLEKIDDLIVQAEELADKTGIPFQISIGGLEQTYTPQKLHEKIEKLEKSLGDNGEELVDDWKHEFVYDVLNVHLEYEAGWDNQNWNYSRC